MPRVESSRAKSVEPTRTTSPLAAHRKLPNTPAAVSRSNPLDSGLSPPSKATEKEKEKEPSKPLASSIPPTSNNTRPTAPIAPPAPAPVPEVEEPVPDEEIIEMETFEQILEMDDDDPDREFSKSIVLNYFEQAETTFDDMDNALKAKDLEKLSQLGHFLKGSSAALGVSKVRNTCESMQNYGRLRDEDTKSPNKTLTPEQALKKIAVLTGRVRGEYKEAETWLKDYFGESLGA